MSNISSIFPQSTQFPIPLYPIITILGSLSLYTALYHFNLQKIITNLFSICSNLPSKQSTLIYLILINTPMIILSGISLFSHRSLMGFQISCDLDYIQIVLVSSYISYIQQSRQTPIRGLLFLRDILFMCLELGTLVLLYYNGRIQLQYGIVIISIFSLYYIIQQFEQSLQQTIPHIFGIKQTNVYNSIFLLTQPNKQSNHLKMRNVIVQNNQAIQSDIHEFNFMLDKLFNSETQKFALANFAKLFLPYKNAIEIQEQNQLEENILKIGNSWEQQINECSTDNQEIEYEQNQMISQKDHNQNQQIQQDQQDQQDSQYQQYLYRDAIMYNRAMTDDFVMEDQANLNGQESILDKVLKFLFHPLFLISTVQGRPRYFLDYFCVFLMCATLWLISCGCSYLTTVTSHTSYSIISVAISICLCIPSSKYFLHSSQIHDYDFLNIFLQSAIIKITFYGLYILAASIIDSTFTVTGNIGLMVTIILNLSAYMIFGIFFVMQKFATLKSNLKYFVGMSIALLIVRVMGEIFTNLFIRDNSEL